MTEWWPFEKVHFFHPICLIMEILRNDVVFREKVILTSKIIQNTGLISHMKLHTHGSKAVISLKTVFAWKIMKTAVKDRFFGNFGAFGAHEIVRLSAQKCP